LSKIYWNDTKNDSDTSLPIPIPIDPIKTHFLTNLSNFVPAGGNWVLTTDGLMGGSMENAFFMSNTYSTSTESFELEVKMTFITKDGNPTTNPINLTRDGSAASLIFHSYYQQNPLQGCFSLNISVISGTFQIQLIQFPYYELYYFDYIPPIVQEIPMRLKISFDSDSTILKFYLDDQYLFDYYSEWTINGYIGLGVWQGSVLFDEFYFRNV